VAQTEDGCHYLERKRINYIERSLDGVVQYGNSEIL
jgi:hypothetical protein